MTKSNSILTKNLQYLLKMHDDLSISELARHTQIPQPTLHHLLSGLTQRPRRRVLEGLAKFFSISIAQLTGSAPLPKRIPATMQTHFDMMTIPIIPWELLNKWPDVTTTDCRPLLLQQQLGANSFALIMPDTSMEPLFSENALLIFDSDKKPQDRAFVVVYLVNSEAVLFNRVFIEDNHSFIKHSEKSGAMELVKIDPRVDRILGILVEVRVQL